MLFSLLIILIVDSVNTIYFLLVFKANQIETKTRQKETA